MEEFLSSIINFPLVPIIIVPTLMLLISGVLKSLSFEGRLPPAWVEWLVGIDLCVQGLSVIVVVILQQLVGLPHLSEVIKDKLLLLLIGIVATLIFSGLTAYLQRRIRRNRRRFYLTNGLGFLSWMLALILWR